MPRSHLMALACALALARMPLLAIDVPVALIDQNQQPVVGAVVSLTPLDVSAPPATPPATMPEIVQAKEMFSPLVTIVRTGTTVAFPNQDEVDHHLYSQSPAKKFNFPLYAPEKSERVTFDQPGIVTIGCNIHDTMIAYVIVLETPWYAQTANGSARLHDVPPGRYRLDIWHPRQKEPLTEELTITADGAAPAVARTLSLSSPSKKLKAKMPGAGYH